MINAADFVRELKLSVYSPSTRVGWEIPSADLNRPGLQFTGFYDYFAWERPQVIGLVEMSYLQSLNAEDLKALCERYFSYNIPCIICCRGLKPPREILEAARAHDVPVYITEATTTAFTFSAINNLNRCLAPQTMKHSVLLDVYCVVVIING